MSAIDDGGPAFPSGDNDSPAPYESGMSLRIYLAGQVLSGLVQSASYGAELHRIFDSDNAIADAGPKKESPQEYTARIALSLADALLQTHRERRAGK